MYIFILGGVILAIYFYLKHHYSFWERQGIVGPKPNYFFGNHSEVVTFKRNPAQVYNALYKEYEGYDFIGFFKFSQPAIIIRSTELIRKIFTQDFEYFQSNDIDIGDHDDVSSRNPFLQSGSKWKKTRAQITPSFTSGKLKNMVPLTSKASCNMVDYIKTNMDKCDGFETRSLFTKYTSDNVASIAFGLEANSYDDSKAEFMRMGTKMFDINIFVAIKFIIMVNFPRMTKWLNIHFIPKDVCDYYRDIIMQTLKYRRESSIERNDFLKQMMDLQSKLGEEEFGITDILAHSTQFIVNGMETSASTMAFMIYSIANHLDAQQKAREEIDKVLEKHNGEITYEAIKEMEYMDQILNETIRLYPAASINLKRCTKDYTIPKSSNLPEYTIKVGTPVMIPMGGIHRDPKYHPSPETFNPDRFAPENVESIPKYSFLPFGDGPRICLGQRFAVLQIKIGVIRLLREFDIRINKKTIEPLVMDPKVFITRPVNPIYLDFYKRSPRDRKSVV